MAEMVIAPRLPLQSAEPVVWFARIRLLLASVLAFDVPHKARTAIVVGAVAVTWSAGVLALARRRADAAMSFAVALGDLAVLGVVQVAEPDAYAGLRFVALFLIATHAYFLG